MAYYNESKITYQQLVMEQIKIIQGICAKELKDGDKVLKNAMGEQVIEGEDTRYSFLQSVELLGSMLTPYFGSMMKSEDGKSDLFEEFCEYYDTELIELLDNEDFQKRVKDIFGIEDTKKIKTDPKLQAQVNLFLLNDKIKEGRKIFRLLVKVFKANDFLGSQSYGEGSGDGDVDSGNDAFVDDEEGETEE